MKRRVLFIASAVVLLSGIGWLAFSSKEREPVYQGKPLSVWLEIYDPTNRNPSQLQLAETQAALRAMGTNAIPALLRMLERHDSPLKLKLIALAQKQSFIEVRFIPTLDLYARAGRGLDALGPVAEVAVPELIRIYDRNLSPTSQKAIAAMLGHLGPPAKAAVPSLLRGAASADDFVRIGALHALGAIRADPDLVVPVLIKALQDPNPRVGSTAAAALQSFGPDAKPAVPALVKFIQLNPPTPNDSPYLTINDGDIAWGTLQKIDPEASAKVLSNRASVSK